MSHTISATGKPFGLQGVCQALDFPGSAIYAERARAFNKVTPLVPVRRGLKPKAPDHQRLAAGRADLTRTPFVGEGVPKVWARLRIQDDIHVSRARVLPLIREHGLLSPHRQPQKPPNAHDGRMTTDRPNEMWGADGAKVKTVDEGLSGSSLRLIIATRRAWASTRHQGGRPLCRTGANQPRGARAVRIGRS
ncbi:MAG: transposase [Burkholderia sp.]